MIFKKYVVGRFDTYLKADVKAVCDTAEDALEVAELIFGPEKPEMHVEEVLYIRSKQTVARDSLYDMQNGVVTIPTYRGEVINAEL